MPIPGYKELLGQESSRDQTNQNTPFLIMGPGKSRKLHIVNTFFESFLKSGNSGIFLSSTLTKRQYQNLFINLYFSLILILFLLILF